MIIRTVTQRQEALPNGRVRTFRQFVLDVPATEITFGMNCERIAREMVDEGAAEEFDPAAVDRACRSLLRTLDGGRLP